MAVQRDSGLLSARAAEEGAAGELEPPASAPEPVELDAAGIAWLTIPSPGGIVRLPGTVVHALERQLDEVEAGVEAGRVRALVVRAGPSTSGYMDLHDLLASTDERGAAAEAIAGQAALRRLERLAVPSISAIEGACLGAQLELALACSYRIASLSPATRFALPQLRLGVLPALGGTVRLPRLIGVEAALRLIVHGESATVAQARGIGLVDLVVPEGELRAGVERFALERIERGRFRNRARRRMGRRLIEDTAPGRRILFARAARLAAEGRTAPELAVTAALHSVADGIALPLERAFEREAELYGQLLVSEGAKSLIQAALLDEQASHPHPAGGRAIERVAILGAREDGIGFATLLARRGFVVRLKDRERGAVATSVNLLRARLSDAEVRAGVAPDAPRSREERVEGTVGFGGFGVLDLVVASPEPGPDAVLRALAETEEHVLERCILASASPLLRIAELAAGVRDPSRAIGLITSGPAEHFPVLEIASGERTDPETIATACRLARALGLTAVHVADGPGFLVHRLLAVFLAEATRLVHEGAAVEAVDGEMEEYGFVAGPLRRIDAIGAEGTIRLLGALSRSLGARVQPTPVMLWLAARGARFYRYRGARAVGVNPALPAPSPGVTPPDPERVRERLLLALVNEGARVLDEGVVASAADVDLGAIFGVGYPRARGGLLFQADRGGLPAALERLSALAAEHGERFAPAPLLKRLVEAGEGFYPARPLASGQARE